MPFNFNTSSPSAPTGKKGVHWQKDATATPPDVSGYFDLDVAITSASSSGTIAPAAVEHVERVTTGASTITRTLPLATGSNQIVLVKKIDTNSPEGRVVIAAGGSPSDVIEGLTTYELDNQYQYVRLLDAASGVWDIIGGN